MPLYCETALLCVVGIEPGAVPDLHNTKTFPKASGKGPPHSSNFGVNAYHAWLVYHRKQTGADQKTAQSVYKNMSQADKDAWRDTFVQEIHERTSSR